VSTISHERIQENEATVSFDVESIFTNELIEGAVKAALCKLENDPGLADRTNLTPTQIADLLNLSQDSRISNTTGRFTNKKTEQPWGVLSPRKRTYEPSSNFVIFIWFL